MSRDIIHTNHAPAAVGPYSQGIVANGMVFTAGQVGLVPGTRMLAEGGIQGQTRQVLDNLSAILEAAGSALEHVVKVTVYLTDMDDFTAMNEVYATYFGGKPPARTTVAAVGLPVGALVEIDAIALVKQTE